MILKNFTWKRTKNVIPGLPESHESHHARVISPFTPIFGCPMIPALIHWPEAGKPDFSPTLQAEGQGFYFIRIYLPGQSPVYGWSTGDPVSREGADYLKILTKKPLPLEFMEDPNPSISFLPRWTPDQIKQWRSGKILTQGFDWNKGGISTASPAWQYMKGEDYSRKTVLDYGTRTGYFAFQASKCGAVVEGIDHDPYWILMADAIKQYIEQQDVTFYPGTELPKQSYDYIFNISAYHLIDERYKKLGSHLESLKSRCRVLFLELANPPLKGWTFARRIDRMVGGEILLKRKDASGQSWTLYRVEGYLGS